MNYQKVTTMAGSVNGKVKCILRAGFWKKETVERLVKKTFDKRASVMVRHSKLWYDGYSKDVNVNNYVIIVK